MDDKQVPSIPRQRFEKGDLVWLKYSFEERYVIVHSYDDAHDLTQETFENNRRMHLYKVLSESGNVAAWFAEDLLVLVERGRLDLFYEWKDRGPAPQEPQGFKIIKISKG